MQHVCIINAYTSSTILNDNKYAGNNIYCQHTTQYYISELFYFYSELASMRKNCHYSYRNKIYVV